MILIDYVSIAIYKRLCQGLSPRDAAVLVSEIGAPTYYELVLQSMASIKNDKHMDAKVCNRATDTSSTMSRESSRFYGDTAEIEREKSEGERQTVTIPSNARMDKEEIEHGILAANWILNELFARLRAYDVTVAEQLPLETEFLGR